MSLHPDHLKDLRKSGLSDDTITRMECASVRPCEIKGLKGVTSAMRIPYFNLDGSRMGFERWKLFPPYDGTQKYWQRTGTQPAIYLPPLCNWSAIATDASTPIEITEGEKKAAAGCQHGRWTIGIGGVWAWRYRDAAGESQTLPFFTGGGFVIAGRRIVLIPDSDAWRPGKELVLDGMYALAKELERYGATVSFNRLADMDGEKTGYDDYLLRCPA